MTKLEDDLRAALHAESRALHVPERPALDSVIVELRRRPGSRWLLAAACLTLVVAGVFVLAQVRGGDPGPTVPLSSTVPGNTLPTPIGPGPTAPVTSTVPGNTLPTPIDPGPTAPVTSTVPGSTLPTPITNGWVAFESTEPGGGDIYLVRPGEEIRPLSVEGSDSADEACPAWSPDGTRLLVGRVNGSSDTASGPAELVVVPVGADGAVGAPNVIGLEGFEVLEGFDAHPCGIWAPDGRWVALAGTGEVWVVDTQTDEIRRLPDLRPSDLEWRPGTDELTIAGDVGLTRAAPTLSTPVTAYSVSTDELRPFGEIEAAHITWSPDGLTLAYTGGEQDPHELWLVAASGADERLLVADTGENNHGIGPIWSPTGDRIAYQRLCCARAETHDVVLVDVADGLQTVIAPPEADGPGENVRWYPINVTWSPDGQTLLYTAWRSGMPPGEEDGRAHVITVPIDTPSEVTVLGLGGLGDAYVHGWALPQVWGRHPV